MAWMPFSRRVADPQLGPRARRARTGLACLAIAGGLTALGAIGLAGARSPVTAQPSSTVTAHLHSPTVGLRGAPGARTVLTLGRRGRVQARLESAIGAASVFTGELRDGTGALLALRPGDRLTVSVGVAPPVGVAVPSLRLRAEAGRRRMVVQGPATAGPEGKPTLRWRGPEGAVGISILDPSRDGEALASWPAAWRPDPGFAVGLDWPVSSGITVSARWDAPQVTATLGAAELRGHASRGARVDAAAHRAATVALAGEATADGEVGARAGFTLALVARPGAPPPPVLGAADRLSVSLEGEPLLEAVAPRVRARVLPAEDRVAGLAPPGEALVLRARAQDARASLVFTVPASGAFSVSVAGELDLSPESEVWIDLPHAQMPIVWRSRAEAERLTATLGSSLLHGRAAPYSTVAASLKGTEAQDTLAEAVADSGATGGVALRLLDESGDPVIAEPGRRLLVVWELGGSVDATLPDLQARFDAATEQVVGLAPPGSRLRVRLSEEGEEHVVDLRARADGTFAAPFPGAGGSAVLRGTSTLFLGDVLTVVRPFSVAEARATLDHPTVRVRGAPGAQVRLEVHRGGRVLGSAAATLGAPEGEAPAPECSPCDARLLLRDAEDFPVPLLSGDRLHLYVDGQGSVSEVPRVAVEANSLLDRVRGNAAPAEALVLDLGREASRSGEIELSADERGVFALRPGRDAGWAMRPGDHVTLTARAGPFSFAASSRVDGLVVDLEAATVSGLVGPGERLSLGLYSSMGERAALGAATADDEGRFEIDIREPLGGIPRIEGGQVLVVQAGTRVTTTRIPALSLRPDAPDDALSGRLDPPGHLGLRVERPTGDRGRRVVTETRTAEPEWRLELGGLVDVAAGVRLTAESRDGEGHVFLRSLRVPQLHARSGDVLVHGQASAGATVRITVTRGGGLLASATRKATDAGVFQAELATEPLSWRLRAGDLLEATWTDGLRAPRQGRMQLRVQEVTTTLLPEAGAVEGSSKPEARLELRLSDGAFAAGGTTLATRSRSDGSYRVSLPGAVPLVAGTHVEAGVLDAEGHRTYAADRLPFLDLRLRRAVLTGRAAPRRALTLSLRASGTRAAPVLDTVRLSAGAQGSFVASFADRSGRSIALNSGMALEVAEENGRYEWVDIPELSVRIEKGAGRVSGTAKPGSEVELRLLFLGRPTLTRRPRADEEGRWHVDFADLPPSTPPEALRRAEARQRSARGHRIVAIDDPSAPSATVPPTAPAPTVTGTPVGGSGTPGTPSPTPSDGGTPHSPTPRANTPTPPALVTPTPEGLLYLPRVIVSQPDA